MESLKSIAKMIDHSLLHPSVTDEELKTGCGLARHFDVASVCIKPYAVVLARQFLRDTDVKTGTVVGFPHGSHHLEIKLKEAEQAIADGAEELDAVVNIGKVLSQDWDYVEEEIRVLNRIAVDNGALLKVIFENDFLAADELKIELCHICNSCQVAFVKTSTGYGFVKQPDGKYLYKGATDHDLRLMIRETSPKVKVKAAGGIRTLDDLLRVKALGVSRVGASATRAILDEAISRLNRFSSS
jgi:deoxyribose-phosphate aldolase